MTAIDHAGLAAELLELARTIERSPPMISQKGLFLKPIVPVSALDTLKEAAAEIAKRGATARTATSNERVAPATRQRMASPDDYDF